MALPEKRWVQRLDNYSKVLRYLEDFVTIQEERPLSVAEEFAIIKTFELAFESGWKSMRDFLQSKGNIGIDSPKDAIRQAFSKGIIENGQVWIDMIESRKEIPYCYDETRAVKVATAVSDSYANEFKKFLATMKRYENEKE
ncbi:MAG: nucleotidyltransferase substrate binding protein [Chitinispirillales bacterium]|jgi:nucleotidyltransferase substrate binding protein (TIGR01987 family)|nr:nucleotidyltransferase substrate binding protein [Chitinispirillales bacterium]